MLRILARRFLARLMRRALLLLIAVAFLISAFGCAAFSFYLLLAERLLPWQAAGVAGITWFALAALFALAAIRRFSILTPIERRSFKAWSVGAAFAAGRKAAGRKPAGRPM